MARMLMLQPELKEIQKQYKDDQQRMQQEVMAFYKKNNVNPLSGCLPLILQMPIFFALFQLLRDLGVKVMGAGSQTIYKFLWMDLRTPDPFYILVILMVGTMIVTSKMTQTDMTKTGASQALMTYLLPVVFGFISIRLQSGILIYWVTTNIWSIGQQYFVNKMVLKEKGKSIQKNQSAEQILPGQQIETKIIKPKSKKRRK
jgi:YidC/Oxa1 family membrane protein insertase